MSQGPAGSQRATYRGVRWRREAGQIAWFNEGRDRWIRWYPGADAPPLPPRWAADAPAVAAPTGIVRPGWRTPYRLVPIVLIVAAVTVGIVQALRTGPTNPVTAEAKAAAALDGRCLRTNGTRNGHPTYAATGVDCTAADAAVRVTEVLPGTPSAPTCPTATTPVRLAYVGVEYPHVLCVAPVTR